MTLLTFFTPQVSGAGSTAAIMPQGWSVNPLLAHATRVFWGPPRFPWQDSKSVAGYNNYATFKWDDTLQRIPANHAVTVGFAVYFSSLSQDLGHPFMFYTNGGWSEITMNGTTGVISSSSVTAAMAPLAEDAWHYIELHMAHGIYNSPTLGNNWVLHIRVNGETVLESNSTPFHWSGSNGSRMGGITGVSFRGVSSLSNPSFYIADMYVQHDPRGEPNWLGDVTVDRIIPEARADHPEYTGTFSMVGSADEPGSLSAKNPDESKYISTEDGGASISYEMSAFPVEGPSEIVAVMPLIYGTKDGTAVTTINPFLRMGDDVSLGDAAYLGSGVSGAVNSLPRLLNPAGNPWTAANLLDTEVGLTVGYE